MYSIDKGRENTKNSGSIGIKESVCRSVKDNGRRVVRSHDFSFLLIFPILSTIPNLLHTFSVHLMNCYFSDFWYSHVTEKRTLRREKCNMRKKQDIIWEQSTLITKQIQAIKMEFPKPELHFILFLQLYRPIRWKG